MSKFLAALIIGLLLIVDIWCLYFSLFFEGDLKKWANNLVYRNRIKHRFGKPPTAKCYCIDCKYHDNKNGRCSGLGEFVSGYKYTEDNWFCYNADPRKKEE